MDGSGKGGPYKDSADKGLFSNLAGYAAANMMHPHCSYPSPGYPAQWYGIHHKDIRQRGILRREDITQPDILPLEDTHLLVILLCLAMLLVVILLQDIHLLIPHPAGILRLVTPGPSAPPHPGHGPGMGTMVAGGLAAAYGMHQMSHGAHHLGHGAFYGPHGHGKFKDGKFGKRWKHGMFGKHKGGFFRRWK